MTDNPYRLLSLVALNINKETKAALLADLTAAYEKLKVGSRERVEFALLLQYVEQVA